MYKLFIKRLLDLVLSILFLAMLSPLLIVTLVAILLDTGFPIFYTQVRLGYRKKKFKLYKFRSMRVNNKVDSQVFNDNVEITKVGRIIRRYKTDELAQLLNIIKGDMSIVGPRPCLPSLESEFTNTAHNRFKSKPGLTGLAQVNGNIFLTWEQRWKYDEEYVENITFFGDLKIVLKTFLIVFQGEEKFKN